MASTIRLLTANVLLRPPLFMTLKRTWKEDRLNDLVDFITEENYDIVCFQEVCGRKLRTSLLAAAKTRGFPYFACSPSPSGGGGLKLTQGFTSVLDGGLVILSRYPLSDVVYQSLPKGVGADQSISKGVLHAIVEFTNSNIKMAFHLFTAHLQTQTNLNDTSSTTLMIDETSQKSELVRRDQIRALANFARQKCSNDSLPALLFGCLNVNSRKGKNDSSDSDSYIEMLNIFRQQGGFNDLRDLLRECNRGNHPITADDVIEQDIPVCPELTQTTNPSHFCRSVDYAIELRHKVRQPTPITQQNQSEIQNETTKTISTMPNLSPPIIIDLKEEEEEYEEDDDDDEFDIGKNPTRFGCGFCLLAKRIFGFNGNNILKIETIPKQQNHELFANSPVNGSNSMDFSMENGNTCVVPLKAPPQKPYGFLSDHYAISSSFIIS